MSQLIYPLSLIDADNKIHSILFNINTLESADFGSTDSRIVENPEDHGLMTELYKNPFGNTPILYQKNSGQFQNATNQPDEIEQLITNYTRTEDSIVLQMPDNLGSNYGIEWKHSDFGASGRLSNLLWTAGQDPGEAMSQFKESIAASSGDFIAGGLQNISGINFQDILQRTRGSIINPLIETIFKGVSNRSFQFKFKFYPKSEEEAYQVLDIITKFKRHMHPELINGAKPFFKYPDTFDVTFMLDSGSRNPWLFRMSTCALTDLTTNETPNSKYVTHEGGSPVVRELDLTFTEMEQLHKDRFLNGDSF